MRGPLAGSMRSAAAGSRLASWRCSAGQPASAASVAGLFARVRAGESLAGLTAVCVITGSGLKDPETALGIGAVTHRAPADPAAVAAALGWRAP